jgi:hypothetical protein
MDSQTILIISLSGMLLSALFIVVLVIYGRAVVKQDEFLKGASQSMIDSWLDETAITSCPHTKCQVRSDSGGCDTLNTVQCESVPDCFR